MDDNRILARLLAHDETGLAAAQEQYGARLKALAARFIGAETAEECVNDALLAAWEAIPPLRPDNLFAYLCKLTRNAAFNRYRADTAQKRGGQTVTVSMEELSECLTGGRDPARQAETSALSGAVTDFLRSRPRRERNVFLARYFYAMPLREIAERFAMRENTVKTTLYRTRQKLRRYLEQEGLL